MIIHGHFVSIVWILPVIVWWNVLLQIISMSWPSLAAGRSQSRTMQNEQATRDCCLEKIVPNTNHGPMYDVLAPGTSRLKYAMFVTGNFHRTLSPPILVELLSCILYSAKCNLYGRFNLPTHFLSSICCNQNGRILAQKSEVYVLCQLLLHACSSCLPPLQLLWTVLTKIVSLIPSMYTTCKSAT